MTGSFHLGELPQVGNITGAKSHVSRSSPTFNLRIEAIRHREAGFSLDLYLQL